MPDRGKILIGIAVFVVLVTFPFWGRLAAGDAALGRPDLEYPDAAACVEDSAYMNANHMDLLNQWRDDLVRNGILDYTSSASGETFRMSLTKTCLDCHDNRDEFCTACHDYANVTPTCWECHTTLGGGS
ncbi:sulfate reduction electron transfer complex DsrMKJOP subunit DsrJ [Gemmatimonadota bacterium]